MRNYKILSAIFLAGILINFSSCSDDSIPMGAPNGSVSEVSQSQSDLKSVSKTAGEDVSDITQSEGVVAVKELNSVMSKKDAFSNARQNKRIKSALYRLANHLPLGNKMNNLRLSVDDSLDENKRFVFSEHTGTYTWKESVNDWEYDKNNPADKIIFIYPSDDSHRQHHENNAILTIYYYTDIDILSHDSLFFRQQTRPTSLSADLKIDRKLVASENFLASWDDQGNPLHVENVLYIKPFTWSFLVDVSPTTIYGSTFLNKEGDGTIVATEGTITFTDNQKEDIDNVNGYVQYRELKIQGNVNVKMIEEADSGMNEPKSAILNEAVNVGILHRNRKVGSIYFVDVLDTIPFEPGTRPVAYIKFNDGSMEEAETYFEDVRDAIDKEFDRSGGQGGRFGIR